MSLVARLRRAVVAGAAAALAMFALGHDASSASTPRRGAPSRPAASAPASGPAASRPAASRPIQLVQAGNSKTSCITLSLDSLPATFAATGIHFECVGTFATSAVGWADWVKPWFTDPQYGFTRWLAASPDRRTVVIALNLIPTSLAGNPDWRARGADGRYDKYARSLAKNLVRAGFGYSVIRLGQEMNGPWEYDWVGNTVTSRHQWARFFARIVTTMRAVPGAHFLFDWNVNAGYENIPLDEFYPGNAYVDIVGVDAYDEAPIRLPPVGSPTRWQTLVTEPLGLIDLYKYARQQGKPFSIPEWGTLSTSGDDPAYVRAMGRFVATHDVAYQAWFDNADNNILPLDRRQAPRSLRAYVAMFGPGSAITRYQRGFDHRS